MNLRRGGDPSSSTAPTRILAVAILAIGVIIASCTDRPVPVETVAAVLRNADSISRHEILDLSVKHNGVYDNRFLDVALEAVFTSPTGTRHRIKGFYYGADVWKVRFRPDEVGTWTYGYVLMDKAGFRYEGTGAFDCNPSDADGPVRRHPANPYRWVFASGKPYFPIGLQDCIGTRGADLGSMYIDGGERGGNNREIPPEEYFSTYGHAGFNLLRFSQRNCSYTLYDNLESYRQDESLATDEILSLARKHGFRVMFGFFGYHARWIHGSPPMRILRRHLQNVLGTPEEALSAPYVNQIVTKEKRFVQYAVARWGVYVDFWELLNEREASDEWTILMADYVRSVDPHHKPISTSWEKPHLAAIDINAPHWYESESELQSDLRVRQQAAKWKQAGKPVIVGEQGNTGMNWDPGSALRMRIRAWTALFDEISLIFWNTSWSKAGMFHGRYTPGAGANIYLGPEERGYIKILQEFSSRLDAGVRIALVEVSSPDTVRAFGLQSDLVAAVYLHHFANHAVPVRNLKITLNLPAAARSKTDLVAEWMEPSTGNVLGRARVSPGRQTLAVPPFSVDLALLVIF